METFDLDILEIFRHVFTAFPDMVAYLFLFWWLTLPLLVVSTIVVIKSSDKIKSVPRLTALLCVLILAPFFINHLSMRHSDVMPNLVNLARWVWPQIVVVVAALASKRWAWLITPITTLLAGAAYTISELQTRGFVQSEFEKLVLFALVLAIDLALPVGILVSLAFYYKGRKKGGLRTNEPAERC
jgi:hypothetical protein